MSIHFGRRQLDARALALRDMARQARGWRAGCDASVSGAGAGAGFVGVAHAVSTQTATAKRIAAL